MGWARRRLGFLQRWWVCALLAAFLGWNTWASAHRSARRGEAGPGWLARVAGLEPRGWTGEAVTNSDLFAVREDTAAPSPAGAGGPAGAAAGVERGGTVRLIDTERESWGELGALHEKSPQRLAAVVFTMSVERTGPWAPIVERLRASIRVEPYEPGAFTGEQVRLARRLAAERFIRSGGEGAESLAGQAWSRRAASLADGDLDEPRILWSGVGLAASAAAGIGAWAWSLGWVPRAVHAWRRRRGRRRLSRGLCPACGYELLGSEAAACPECGAPIAAPPGRAPADDDAARSAHGT
jgi:hypothetical protein